MGVYNLSGVLICQLEDADLYQLVDGEVFESASLHVLDEVWCDLEDADLY